MSGSDNFNYEIAIIGMAGRFPGARSVDQFWQNLRDGVESISFFSDEELEAAGVERSALSDPNYVKAGAVLDDLELFDASFFGFNPREAEIMDPQHRFFLECAWEALEAAGYDSETYPGRIGVYAGCSMSTYLLHNLYANRDLVESVGAFQTIIENDKDHLPTWLSYKLNLKGPSVNVQTACSTSLVAVHLACQSLLNHECDMALAGGVSVKVPSKQGYLYQEGGITSPDGHCRAFDSRAQGTVGGSGVGIVVLKRLADALKDGDSIQAVIKGSAINNDGSLKVSYTAPGVDGQAGVIAEALAMAMVDPETVTYVETHGTATALGDPIEIAALTQAFRASTEKKGFCAIGSVKTNIGHLDAAAGVASLIKTVLGLKHKQIPPSLHFTEPNPQIDFAESPFYVNVTLSEWRTQGAPRRAGVSSFGIGGTNAHVVLEEAPPVESYETHRPAQLLVLSAKTATALEAATSNLAAYMQRHTDANLADITYTLQVGRRAFNHRLALVCHDKSEAVTALSAPDEKRVVTHLQERAGGRAIAFMFSGQGAQSVNMASELYRVEPTFRQQVDLCSEILRPHLGLDLRHVLYPTNEQAGEAASQIDQTFITQPAIFVVEYALSKLFMEWGVVAQALIGHSIGEYVAACLSGVFSLEDALSLVAARGRLMQQLPRGAMIAVPLTEGEVQPLLAPTLSLAAINAPRLTVVSGPTDAVQQLETRLSEQGLSYRRLRTSHAFHSRMMEPILSAFAEQVSRVSLKPPRIPYVSNVTGTWITAAQATDPSYWVKHLRRPVRFADGVGQLLKDPARILLEVGPGETLSALAKQHPDLSGEQMVLGSLSRPRGGQSDSVSLLEALGQLWLAGVEIDWPQFHAYERRRRTGLPTYPFERPRYWIEPQEQTTRSPQDVPGKKPEMADWFYVPSWKRSIPPATFESEDTGGQRSGWLLFISESDLCLRIVERVEQMGQEAIAVKAGDQFARLCDRVYTINPRQPDDYHALLKELRTQAQTFSRIIHLWNLTSNDDAQASVKSFEESQDTGFYSLIFLAQALGEQNVADHFQIAVVSNGVHEVTGEEALRPEKATLLGPCKVIPQEYPNITCRSIDIAIPEAGTAREEELIEHLISEVAAQTSSSIVAYRGDHRWVQMFEPVRLDEEAGQTGRLREGGVYLLTGGLGDSDLALARNLATGARARLILTGHSDVPEREEWEQYLATHDEQTQVSRRVRSVRALEELGAEVLVINANVADEEEMRVVIAQARARFGEIHGVFHTAWTPGGGMIQLKTPEVASSVMASKVRGALALVTALKDVPLDFVLLFSSTLSITGVFGQVDYCAANAFLDAFAHQNFSRRGTPVVSVNWGMPQWESWQESLMAGAAPQIQTELKGMQQTFGITLEEGVAALNRILSGRPFPQIVISTQNFQSVIDQQNAFTASSFLEELEKARLHEPAHSRPVTDQAYVPPTDEVEQRIARVWQELFGISRVGIHDNFFDLGGNSLLAIQLVSQLRKAFEVDLPMSKLFESPTVADLARVIKAGQQEQAALEEISRILGEIEGLSLDEVQARLAEEP